jgi:hypothetical protein
MVKLMKLLWIAGAVLLVGFLTLSPYAAIKSRAEPKEVRTAVMQSGWVVRIWDEPCAFQDVLKVIADKDLATDFRAGQSISPKGEKLNLCWIFDEGRVFLIDSNSDYGSVDPRNFKDKSI